MAKVLCIRKAPNSPSGVLPESPNVIVGEEYTVLDFKPHTDMMLFVPKYLWAIVDIPKGMWYKLIEMGHNWYHESLFAAMIEEEDTIEQLQTHEYDRTTVS